MKKMFFSLAIVAGLCSCTKVVHPLQTSDYVVVDSVKAHMYGGKVVYQLYDRFTGKHVDSMHVYVCNIGEYGITVSNKYAMKNPGGSNAIIFTDETVPLDYYFFFLWADGKMYTSDQARLIIH